MEKGTAVWKLFLSTESCNPDLYALFSPDEKGHYPYIVAAYKFEGDNGWRMTPLPAPFEKAVHLLKERGITLPTLRQVSLGGSVSYLEMLDHVFTPQAYNKGWNLDYEDCNRWYAPGEDIPMPKNIAESENGQISLKLIAIAANWIEFQVRQGDKKQHMVFESHLSDGLPGMAFLLKSLIERGYGHMSLSDTFAGTFFKMSVWCHPDGFARMAVKYDSEEAESMQWFGKAKADTVIENIREFLLDIADHPDFLHEYAFHEWDAYRGFENELDEAMKKFLTTPPGQRTVPPKRIVDETDPPVWLTLFEDDEDRFQLQWLRENITRLEPARKMHARYQRMLRDLLIPEGWLDLAGSNPEANAARAAGELKD